MNRICKKRLAADGHTPSKPTGMGLQSLVVVGCRRGLRSGFYSAAFGASICLITLSVSQLVKTSEILPRST